MARKTKKQCVTKVEVKKLIKANDAATREMKYFNKNSIFGNLLDYSSVVEDITAVTRGDGDSQRDGDRLFPTSLHLSYTCYGETNSSVFRIIVFRWLPATVPIAQDILFTLGIGYATNSDYQHDQRNQFNVLYDKTHVGSNNGNESICVTRRLKLARKQIDYTAAGTGGSNKLYVMALTDRVLVTSGTMQYVSRLYYYDS